MHLDQQTLKSLLTYCPDTGEFRRLYVARGRQKVGTVHKSGHVCVRVGGRRYLAHRLAFLYMEGVMPAMVDHINGDRADNRWCNLRAATPTMNSENRRRPQPPVGRLLVCAQGKVGRGHQGGRQVHTSGVFRYC